MDGRWAFTAVVWGLHEVVFFATWAFFGWLHVNDIAPKFKVAAGKAPPADISTRAVSEVLKGQLLLLPFVAFVVYPAWVAMGGHAGDPGPTMFTMGWQIVACILLQDTMFYWSHRALHSPKLFRAIHRKHHDFRYVRGHSAEYAHPVELAANVVSFLLPPVLLGIHIYVFAAWVIIRVFETVEAHSGYAFTRIASRHAYHHLYASRGCLGSFFGVWDRLMGTDAHWRAWHRQQTHR